MRKTDEEKGLLAKLASGILDGMVGDERVYRGYKNVYCGKYIKDGEPVSYRQGHRHGRPSRRTWLVEPHHQSPCRKPPAHAGA